MTDDQNNPFAAPVAEVRDVAPAPGENELGGRGARLAAVVLDTVITVAVGFGSAMAVGLSVSAMSDQKSPAYFGVLALSFLGFIAVQGYLLHTQGQTVGKKIMGLRIVRTDGSRATLGRLLGLRTGVMWIVSLIPVVGSLISLADGLMIFRDSRQCLHDQIADTIVVRA